MSARKVYKSKKNALMYSLVQKHSKLDMADKHFISIALTKPILT